MLWCEFVGDGEQLVTLDEEGKLQVVDASTLKPFNSLQNVHCATVSPDGKQIVCCHGYDLKWLDVSTFEVLTSFNVGKLAT